MHARTSPEEQHEKTPTIIFPAAGDAAAALAQEVKALILEKNQAGKPAVLGLAINYSAYEAEIYRAGLQAIPDDLYEAARIDGASAWSQFRHVTLPLLGPVLLLVGILTMAGYFQLFAEPYVMTQGGPLESTVSVLYLMYEQGFKWWNLGAASAVAFVLFALMGGITSGLLWFARRRGAE